MTGTVGEFPVGHPSVQTDAAPPTPAFPTSLIRRSAKSNITYVYKHKERMSAGYLLDGRIFWHFKEDTAFPRHLAPARCFSKDGKKKNHQPIWVRLPRAWPFSIAFYLHPSSAQKKDITSTSSFIACPECSLTFDCRQEPQAF